MARERLLSQFSEAGVKAPSLSYWATLLRSHSWQEKRAGAALARLHKEHGESADDMAQDVRALALWVASRVATGDGNAQAQARNLHTVEGRLNAALSSYNEGMGVHDAVGMAVAPTLSIKGKEIHGVRKSLMLPSPAVLEGREAATAQDKTALAQLAILESFAKAKARKENSKILLIMQGKEAEYGEILKRRFPALLSPDNSTVELAPLEAFRAEGSSDYSVAQVAQRFNGLPFDMFVYDASRWDMTGVNTDLVRLLLLAAGNLVVDVTQGIEEDVRTLTHVRVNA
jgi:hypothetical protein